MSDRPPVPMVAWTRRWILTLKTEVVIWVVSTTIFVVLGVALHPEFTAVLVLPFVVNVLLCCQRINAVLKAKPDVKKEVGATVNVTLATSGNSVRYTRDGEVLYEGPVDDAPDYVREDMRFLVKNKPREGKPPAPPDEKL